MHLNQRTKYRNILIQESPPALTRKRHTDRGIFRMGGGGYLLRSGWGGVPTQVWMGGGYLLSGLDEGGVWPGPAGGGGGTLAGGRGGGTLAGGEGGGGWVPR